MDFDIITAFPPMFDGPLSHSIVRRARERGLIQVRVHDLRAFSADPHRRIDDAPYGGGGGMVLAPAPIFTAVEAIRGLHPVEPTRTILFCPQGTPYDQVQARRLSDYARVILICGRYEGVDERVRLHLADEEISIGDYVLTGGEIPAMALVDSLTRLLPGALGDDEAASNDSFSGDGLDHPHYTRPAEFRGWKVPEILLSGDHRAIAEWRRARALEATARKRPDLLKAPRALSGPEARQDH
jgi:tRNA (guanine37-N1)-methyltransferase